VNLSVPTEKTVLSNSGATTTDIKFFYDGLSFGHVNVGNQTQEQDWITGTAYASSTETYNSYGLVATSTDRDGNATAYKYDSFNMYPATTTNALSQSTTDAYNYSNGKIATTTNPNGGITRTLFDGLGRVTEIDQSNPATPTSLSTSKIYQYTDVNVPFSAIDETDYLNSATTTYANDYYDGLGRLVEERRSTENSGTSSVTDYIYNSSGLLASQSLPYFASGSSLTSTSSASGDSIFVIGGGGGSGLWVSGSVLSTGSGGGGGSSDFNGTLQAGGGGGGAGTYDGNEGGATGGGGGGLAELNTPSISAGTYTITIGTGGSKGPAGAGGTGLHSGGVGGTANESGGGGGGSTAAGSAGTGTSGSGTGGSSGGGGGGGGDNSVNGGNSSSGSGGTGGSPASWRW
jgi:hypothetical protein